MFCEGFFFFFLLRGRKMTRQWGLGNRPEYRRYYRITAVILPGQKKKSGNVAILETKAFILFVGSGKIGSNG